VPRDDLPYRQYTRSLLLETRYRAVWLPSETIELGAIGFLEDGLFDQRARLKDFDVAFTTKTGEGRTTFEYQSSTGVKTSYKAAGESAPAFHGIAKAHAGVRFDFTRFGAVVFSAPKCAITEIDNKRVLERRLRGVPDWDMKWVVVTKAVKAHSATILVSGTSGAFVELRASGDIGPSGVDLADLAVGFSRAGTSGMAVKLVAEGRLTPLYEAFRMQQPALTRDRSKRRLVRT
jgi:hypothetical protein